MEIHKGRILSYMVGMARFRFVFAAGLIVAFLVLSGCGGNAPEPTPTPTKTPLPVVEETVPNTPTPAPQVEVAVTSASLAILPTATPYASLNGISPYSGLPAENPANLERRPIFICINNDAAGREAHWGLSGADVVYEYIVDGFTLTRITAMFQGNDSPRVGPVSSARLPNVWMKYM